MSRPGKIRSSQEIANDIIKRQRTWLQDPKSKNAFPDEASGAYPIKSHILGHDSHFDWFIFPGYTRNPQYLDCRIENHQREVVYRLLNTNTEFKQNYNKCLKQYFEALLDWSTRCSFNSMSLNRFTDFNYARIRKVFESMNGIGLNNIEPATLTFAKQAIEAIKSQHSAEYHKIQEGHKSPANQHYSKYFQAFERHFGMATGADHHAAAPAPPPAAAMPTPTVILKIPGEEPIQVEAFLNRALDDSKNGRASNAILRFLARSMGNGPIPGDHVNVARAKYPEGSPIDIIAASHPDVQTAAEQARKLLLTRFKTQLQTAKGESAIMMLATGIYKEDSSIGGFKNKANIDDFKVKLQAWIKALGQPNALLPFAQAYHRAKIQTVESDNLDKEKFTAILKSKTGQGHQNVTSDSFRFNFYGQSFQIANPNGTPKTQGDQLGATSSYSSFCYPNFNAAIKKGIQLPTLQQQVTNQITLAIHALSREMQSTKKTKGLFILNPPGAFIRGLNPTLQGEVKKLIQQAYSQAIKDTQGISTGIVFMAHSPSIAPTTDMQISQGDLLSISAECAKRGIACQVPMMGDPNGAVGNGATSNWGNSALDEFYARACGLLHTHKATQFLKTKAQELKRGAAIASRDPAPAAPAPEPAAAAATPAPASPPAPKPPSPDPKPDGAAAALAEMTTKSQIAKYTNNPKSANPQIKEFLDEQVNSQLREHDPKQVYRGCGIKATFDKNEELVIDEIFAPEHQRFYLMKDGKYIEILNHSLLESTITKINGKNVSEMSLEEIAEACHNPRTDTNFEIKKGEKLYEITCPAKNKNLFVTQSCTSAQPKLDGKAGDAYDVTTHGVAAIDPDGKVNEEIEKIKVEAAAARSP